MTPRSLPVVLDVDTGVDDACALLLAALHPALDLRAVTCVGGNAPVDDVVRNTLTVLEAAGRPDVPVARGAERPLLEHAASTPATCTATTAWATSAGRRATRGPTRATRSSCCATSSPRRPPRADRPHHARAARAADQHRPAAAHLPRGGGRASREIVFMGGAADVGNATASAEFNVFHDPEAAAIVLDAAADLGIPVTMYGLDVFYEPRVTARAGRRPGRGRRRGPAELGGRPDRLPVRAVRRTPARPSATPARSAPSSTRTACARERLPRAGRARRHLVARPHHRRPPRLERRPGPRPARRRRRPRSTSRLDVDGAALRRALARRTVADGACVMGRVRRARLAQRRPRHPGRAAPAARARPCSARALRAACRRQGRQPGGGRRGGRRRRGDGRLRRGRRRRRGLPRAARGPRHRRARGCAASRAADRHGPGHRRRRRRERHRRRSRAPTRRSTAATWRRWTSSAPATSLLASSRCPRR